MNGQVIPLRADASMPAMPSASATDKILRLPQVLDRVGLSTATIYRRMDAGVFPRSKQLGGSRTVGWRESEITAWIAGTWVAVQ